MFDGAVAVMPDNSDFPESSGLIERLVRNEMKVEALREDTKVIRDNIHGIINQMQAFVAAEMACQSALKGIDSTLNDWRPLIQTLIADQGERKGIRLTWGNVGAIVTALIAGAG